MTDFSGYREARHFCDNRRKRKLANNTYLQDYGDRIAVRLHNTDIVTFREGSLTLSSGGWHTPTTKERMNRYLPCDWKGTRASVWQAFNNWYLTASFEGKESATYDYEDGITLHDDGSVTVGERPATVADPDGDKRAYNRERYQACKARAAERAAHAATCAAERVTYDAAREGATAPGIGRAEFHGMSHDEVKATLDARIDSVLAECNPSLPFYDPS